MGLKSVCVCVVFVLDLFSEIFSITHKTIIFITAYHTMCFLFIVYISPPLN